MEVRRYGERALLVTPREVAPLIDHPDIVEVVPGAESVLVVVRAADVTDGVADWVAGLEGEARAGSAEGSGREVMLDVVYDGDDLSAVADAAGLTVDEVIKLHCGALYRCRFCGFAPGFAYLSGLDRRLHLPRRATPRTSVPAGAVAIAGQYTAAYPTASPGGWHLLGRTDATLWDLTAAPPALITPGTTVRFRQVEQSGRSRLRIAQGSARRTGSGVLRVVRTGVATSLQDRGRSGYADLGVPGSGAVDRRCADLVNRLVGNPPEAAVIETAGGLVLEALEAAVVADSTTGALRTLTPGETIAVDPAPGESWAYLSVRGGFAAEQVLGSRSWDSLSELGPQPPQHGQTLARGTDPGRPVVTDLAPHHPRSEQTAVVRISMGPRADWFTADAVQQLTSTDWSVASTSRVGTRLTGQVLARTRTDELPSEGLVIGAIQVPPDGQPVVMLADHPTTGGYPVIAVVAEVDVSSVAQCPPGATLRLRAY